MTTPNDRERHIAVAAQAFLTETGRLPEHVIEVPSHNTQQWVKFPGDQDHTPVILRAFAVIVHIGIVGDTLVVCSQGMKNEPDL